MTARVATGAAIGDATDVQALVSAGISHVVDARGEMDDAPFFVAFPQISYLWNPTQDDGQTKPPSYFLRTLGFSLAALAQPGHRVYLHCAAGINRGPSNAYCLLRAVGFAAGLAEQVIRAARPQVGLAYKNDADAAISILGYE